MFFISVCVRAISLCVVKILAKNKKKNPHQKPLETAARALV